MERVPAGEVRPAIRETVCGVAKIPPQQLGRPFTMWGLSKLVEYLAEYKHIRISTEFVRQILHQAGVRWQATKPWKASKDPDFAAKMARTLDLYDHRPRDGRVICVDEFGPLNSRPARAEAGFPPTARPVNWSPDTVTSNCQYLWIDDRALSRLGVLTVV